MPARPADSPISSYSFAIFSLAYVPLFACACSRYELILQVWNECMLLIMLVGMHAGSLGELSRRLRERRADLGGKLLRAKLAHLVRNSHAHGYLV